MDTFFCTPSSADLTAAVPAVRQCALFSVHGNNGRAKRALLHALTVYAQNRRIPCDRILDAHNADKITAVYAPLQHVFAADGDYFSDFFKAHSENLCFSLHTNDFTDTARAAYCRAECADLQKAETQAAARADMLCKAAAQQKQRITEHLTPYCNKARLAHTVLKYSERYLPPKADRKTDGKILFRRTLSGLTEWGVHTVYSPFSAPVCTRILLCDPSGCFAPALLDGFAAACTACGYNVRLYRCALRGVTEHLTVPALSLAVCTENEAHPFPFTAQTVLHTKNFLKPDAVKLPAAQLRHCIRTADTLSEEAAFSLYEAAQARRTREKLFAGFTDNKRLLLAKNLLLQRFFSVQQNDENKFI